MQTVDAGLESISEQLANEGVAHFVAARDEVPRGAQAERALELDDRLDPGQPLGGLDIVSEHQRPAMTSGPRRDERDRLGGDGREHAEEQVEEVVQGWLCRPAGEGDALLHAGIPAPKPDLRGAR